MAPMHQLSQSGPALCSRNSDYTSYKPRMPLSHQFPAGLRVLVVDDDTTCLRILEQMLRRCLYTVTPCSQATAALNILREKRGSFDVVLSDVHMPDMDGYKLLEHVGLEMDLPVIMMSGDGRTSAVMRGIQHGACDYLIKPIREEELKNIWQHVVRKKWNENKEAENSVSLEDTTDLHKRRNDDTGCDSSVNEDDDEAFIAQKKRRDYKDEEDCELENDDSSSSKKPRVVWSVELHQQFVSAVHHLGIDKAVPKLILELMNVPGLRRENVASHLQKFRLYLKRLSGVAQVQAGASHSFYDPEPSAKVGSPGRFDFQALASSGQIPSQTLAALHAELYGHPAGKSSLPLMDQPALLQASLKGYNSHPVEQRNMFLQPLAKCQSNASKALTRSVISAETVSSRCPVSPSHSVGTRMPTGTLKSMVSQNTDISNWKQSQYQQEQLQWQPLQQPPALENARSISVQPSCIVTPSRSSVNQNENNLGSFSQVCSFNRNSSVDGCISSPSKSPIVGVGLTCDMHLKSADASGGPVVRGSFSPKISSDSLNAHRNFSQQFQSAATGFATKVRLPEQLQAPYTVNSSDLPERSSANTGVGEKWSGFPSRLAVEAQSILGNWDQGKIIRTANGGQVKHELDVDSRENTEWHVPVMQPYTSNELMRVLSE